MRNKTFTLSSILLVFILSFSWTIAQSKSTIKELIKKHESGIELKAHELEQITPYLENTRVIKQNKFIRPNGVLTDIFTEDFSGGALPAGWQNVDSAGNGLIWTFDNPGSRTINTSTSDNGFAIIDSDNNGGPAEDTYLITSAIDASSYSTVYLEFEHYFRSGYGGEGYLYVSGDNGATWDSLDHWSPTSTANAELAQYDISTIAGNNSEVLVAWRWIGDYSWYWAVDDIRVYEPAVDPISEVTPDSLFFSDTQVGDSTGAETITISNTGGGTLTVSSVALGTGDADQFFIDDSNSYPVDLGFGESIMVDVFFAPTSVGDKEVSVDVTDNLGATSVVAMGSAYDPTLYPPFVVTFDTYPPLGWTEGEGALASPVELTSTSSAWTGDQFANTGDDNSAKLNIYGSSRDEWMFSAPIDLGDGTTTYNLSFDLALTNWNGTNSTSLGDDDLFAVVISTDNGATWDSSNTLQTWDSTTPISNTGETVTIDLSGYSGLVQFGFYGESTASNEDNDLFVDNFELFEPTEETVGWCNLQWPPDGTITEGGNFTVYTQAWAEGVTDVGSPGEGLDAWIGVSTEDTDPSTWDTWITATFNTDVGNNDEFMADIAAGLAPGTYYYASRWQLNSGPYSYGGYSGGFWDGTTNVSGVLTVEALVVDTFPYFEGFEDDAFPPAGWMNLDDIWTHGSESFEGNYCARVSYSHDGEAILTTPEFILPENQRIVFAWKDDDISTSGPTVEGHDTTFFEISTDGTVWETLDFLSASSSMSDYEVTQYDLSTYGGMSVWFRWRDVNDGTFSAYGTGVDSVVVEDLPEGAPVAAVNVYPDTNAVDVPLEFDFEWMMGDGPIPTGYYFSLGTDNPPTNLYDSVDVGDTTMMFSGTLEYSTTYYWEVVPYNGTGMSDSNEVWSFTTLADPTVTEFPYFMGFEDGLVPPVGWMNEDGLWSAGSEAYEGDYAARVSYSHAGEAILVTPEFVLPENYRITFAYKDDDISTSGPTVEGHDTTFFEISTDEGASWMMLDYYSAPDNMDAYEMVSYDLSEYGGGSVWFRWRDVTDASFSAWGFGLDNITVEEIPVGPPSPVTLVYPDSGAVDVPVDINLEWASGGGAPETGYILYLGTDYPPTDVIDSMDVGDTNMYAVSLEFSTTYNWMVVPYNDSGMPDSNDVGTFTTLDDPTINTFPYFQSFEEGTPPLGWWTDQWFSSSSYSYDGDYSAVSPYTPEGDSYLEMPPVDLSGLTSVVMTFWWREYAYDGSSDSTDLQISLDGEDWTNLLKMRANTDNADFRQEVVDLTSFVGEGTVYLRWKHWTDGTLSAWNYYLDAVTISEEVEVPAPSNVVALTYAGEELVDLRWQYSAKKLLESIDKNTLEESSSKRYIKELKQQFELYGTTEGAYFNIYKAGTDMVFAMLDSTSELTIIDTSVDLDMDYYYYVTAVTEYGESAPSDTAHARTFDFVVMSEFPYEQGFETEEGLMGWWTEVYNQNGGIWWWHVLDSLASGSDYVHSGRYSAAVMWNGTAASDEWLISPVYDFSVLAENQGAELRFWFGYNTTWLGATLEVMLSTDRGETWTNMWTLDSENGTSPWGWTEANIDLSEYKGGEVMLAFRYVGLDGDLLTIDDMMIDVTTGAEEDALPKVYKLSQNYPNPFNPTTVINYDMPKEGNVNLTVYNILGQEVLTLVNGFREAGYHHATFDAAKLSSGVYIYRIEAGDFIDTKKMILMK
ncbi:MAG: choice-of-anchor J domain-containing protein [Melioribacteraceae bacterium]|nr:choice-of-anchor J domain-containing protein [Melioribacteraceae bacterium]MCF8355085.1 choice-of-anchor J domain-containing protein [Melioribacteraceae bacterium]MCF8395053.1 choice-of-anchor J domain-containing protein [Melioribacteraceae bacterium]MCF8420303.1 choice-of-anchor J domain-containing protein [Melioribacteraceae bacterium]